MQRLLAVVLLCSIARAATLHVPADVPTIGEAVTAASDGDVVLVAAGAYVVSASICIDAKALIVRSEAGAAATVIRAEPGIREMCVVRVGRSHGGQELDGLTITGGTDAGLVLFGTQAAIRNCIIEGNRTSTNGGGIRCEGSSCTLVNCLVRSNSATGGAGMACINGAAPTLIDCTFTENWAADCGGIGCGLWTAVTLLNCTIAGNGAWRSCGGINDGYQSTLTIRNSILWDNAGGSLVTTDGSVVTITYSCIEGPTVPAGPGNINADPLFHGWGDLGEAYVDAGNSQPGDGSEADPFADLGAALQYSLVLSTRSPCVAAGEGGVHMGAPAGIREGTARSARTVYLAAGTYGVGGRTLLHHVSVVGIGAGVSCISDALYGLRGKALLADVSVAGAPGRGLSVPAGEAPEIRAVTVQDCAGGGVLCGYNSAPVLTDCTFLRNGDSGAWCWERSAPTFTRCTIAENTADIGAGLYCWDSSSPTVVDCAIVRNRQTGTSGAVVCSLRSVPTFTGCLISENMGGWGGGFVCADCAPVVTGCTISRNEGSGILCDGIAEPVFSNCAIIENEGTERGGVACVDRSRPRFTNCTIVGNTSSYRTGGISCQDNAVVTIRSCLVWDNTGNAVGVYDNAKADVAYSCIESEAVWIGPGNTNRDPMFVGWGASKEVYVDAANPKPGDGSRENPFRAIESALAYDLRLSELSPCFGAGEAGADMGARAEKAQGGGQPARVVHVAPGTYGSGVLRLVHKVSLAGAGPGETIVAASVRGLRTGAFLENLTVAGADTTGIFVAAETGPEIRNVVIRGNLPRGVACGMDATPRFLDCAILEHHSQGDGGGVQCKGLARPMFEACVFARNSASGRGGAVDCWNRSRPSFIRCTFEHNAAAAGGVLSTAPYASPTFAACTFMGSYGGSTGGCLCLSSQSTATIVDSVLLGSEAGDGGAIYCGPDSSCAATNCVIAGGKAGSRGGAVYCARGAACSITNATIAQNAVDEYGGGLYCEAGAELVLANSIVWDNGDDPPCGDLRYCVTDGDPLLVRPGVFDFERYATMTIDGKERQVPDFVVTPPDYHLRRESPAVDAGTSEGAPAADIEGTRRPCGEAVDAGAYELCAARVPFVRGDATADGRIAINDPVFVLMYLFRDGAAPPCAEAADGNDDDRLNISDPIVVLKHLFRFGGPLPAPWPECGLDAEEGALGCESFPWCEAGGGA